jgi:hypothetical protein
VTNSRVQVHSSWPKPEPSLPVTVQALRKFEFESFTDRPMVLTGTTRSGGQDLEVELRPISRPEIRVTYAGKNADGVRSFRALKADEARALLGPMQRERAASTWDLKNQALDKMIAVLSKVADGAPRDRGWAPASR